MAENDKPNGNNSLSIRLTESAVFLRTDGPTPCRSAATTDNTRTSMLRGLVVLDLIKPTKITSIEVELTAMTSTAWPEGIGARRIDVTEEHRVFHATAVYFRPGNASNRRTASIGPGVSYSHQQHNGPLDNAGYFGDNDGWGEVGGQLPRMDENVMDGRSESDASRNNNEVNLQTLASSLSSNPARLHHSSPETSPTFAHPNPTHLTVNPRFSFADNRSRRVSVDNSHFQRMPLYETYQDAQHLAATPPYSPFPVPSIGPAGLTFPESPLVSPLDGPGSQGPVQGPAAQSLEEFRNSLNSSLRTQSQASVSGSAHTLQANRQPESSLSRHPSTTAIIPENQELETQPPTPPDVSPVRARRSGRPESLSQPRRNPHSPPPLETHPSSSSSSVSQNQQQQVPAPGSERGRKGSRFSLSAVSNILMDAVRSGSPRKFPEPHERDQGSEREQPEDEDARRRGRTMERAGTESAARVEGEDVTRTMRSIDRGKGILGRILKDKDKQKDKVEGWKEFKKGTYTYPISLTIPATAPPTMLCDYGTVTWRLKAHVHRPGAFKPKMTTSRQVTVVACPTEEDTEDTENINVERDWEQQLQYLISISGRSFYVGGTMPITFTLLPLAKVRIHRLSVIIEEKVEYYTNMRRIARTDPVTRFSLLSIKGEGKGTDPILPLDSDSPDALRNSPLFAFVDPNSTNADLSEAASSFMGPGPWTFHKDLKLPKSCGLMKFSNRNRRSNIIVSHILKVVMRVERGDDLHVDGKTGKRKLFDIVVQTPVLIHSCRANPEWSSLPRYAEVFDDSTVITPSCPCQVARTRPHEQSQQPPTNVTAMMERITSRHSSDSSISAVETSPSAMRSLRLMNNEPMLRSSALFERLMSGQESESGEAPPAYAPALTAPLGPTGLPAPLQAYGGGVAVI